MRARCGKLHGGCLPRSCTGAPVVRTYGQEGQLQAVRRAERQLRCRAGARQQQLRGSLCVSKGVQLSFCGRSLRCQRVQVLC